MLTSLEAYSAYSTAPDVPLTIGGSEDEDAIFIREITGIGPVKSDVGTSPYGSTEGEYATGSHVGKRNIVITVGFNPDWINDTVASLRQKLYGYFMTDLSVTLRFFSDLLPTTQITGTVESCEPDIFTKDPSMQISIICPQPHFVAVSPSEVIGDAETDADWEAFSLLSTVKVPIHLEVEADEGDPDYDGLITIEHRVLAESPTQLKFTGAVAEGVKAYVDTHPGNKVIKNDFIVEEVSLLNTMTADSQWPKLVPGNNQMRVIIESTDVKKWTLSYYERFGGL